MRTSKKEKLTEVITTRFTKTEKNKIDEHNVNIRYAVMWYISNLEDPNKHLRYRKYVLNNEIRTIKYELEAKQTELEEINIELGQNTPNSNNDFDKDIIDIGDKIHDNYKIATKKSKTTIANYIVAGNGKRQYEEILKQKRLDNTEEIKNKVLDYISKCKH